MTVTETPADTSAFEALIERDALRIELSEGELVCREGESPDTWWYVVDGFADVTCAGRYLATIGPGETIGEISMLDGRPRTATVVAKSEMTLTVGSADELLARLEASPSLGLAMARQLAARLRDLSEVDGPTASIATPAASPQPSESAEVPATSESSERVAFDPFAPGYFEDPHVQLGHIREQEAIHRIELTGAYMFTRFEHVHALARDRRLGVEIAHALPNPAIDAERAMLAQASNSTDSILRTDGDDHSRVRRLMQKPFTPKRIAEWRRRAVAVSDDLLDQLAANGGGDLIADYALMLPVQIISDLLGMPTDQIGDLRDWSHALTKTLDPLCSPEERAASVDPRERDDRLHRVGVRDEAAAARRRDPVDADRGGGRGRPTHPGRGADQHAAPLHRRPRDDDQPDRERSGRTDPPPGPTRSVAHRPRPRRERRRGGPPVQQPGADHPADLPRGHRGRRHAHSGGQRDHTRRCGGAIAIPGNGVRPPTSSSSTARERTTTCRSVAALTSAWDQRSPAWRVRSLSLGCCGVSRGCSSPRSHASSLAWCSAVSVDYRRRSAEDGPRRPRGVQASRERSTNRSLAGLAPVIASAARITAAAVYDVCSPSGNTMRSGWTMPVR